MSLKLFFTVFNVFLIESRNASSPILVISLILFLFSVNILCLELIEISPIFFTISVRATYAPRRSLCLGSGSNIPPAQALLMQGGPLYG